MRQTKSLPPRGLALIVASMALAMTMAMTITATRVRAAEQSNEESAGVMGEIIVTAQKREESLQNVPIAITVVGEQLLHDTGVRDIKDLTLLTPGMLVTSTSSEASTTARIRGIGTVGDNPGLESSVGVVVDGVYRPRNGVGFGDLGELERVEVLKGPQGTLFGKNTSAGVVNIVTKKPEFDFKAGVELTGGNLSERDGSISLTGPLGDRVAGRLYIVKRTRDGFYDVSTGGGVRTDTEDANRDVTALRGQLLFKISDDFNLRFIADYAKRKENCCAAAQINVGGTAPLVDALATDAGVANPANPFKRLVYSDRPTPQNVRDHGIAAEANWNLSAGTLTSITSFRNWDNQLGQDADFSTADILYRTPGHEDDTRFKQISEELRFAGETGRLKWQAGAFYAKENLNYLLNLRYGTDFETYYSLVLSAGMAPTLVNLLDGRPPGTAYAPGAGYLDDFSQRSSSYAFFTNETFAFTDQFDLTVGARWTKEEKHLDTAYTNSDNGVACAAARARYAVVAAVLPAAAVPSYYSFGCATFSDPIYNNLKTSQQLAEDHLSGTAKLAFRFSDAAMSYLSYARGYKASGYNLDRERNPVVPAPGAPPGPPLYTADKDTSFKPEFVNSYELGLKSTLLDSSLLVDAALFYQKFDDFQLNTFTGISFVVVSIPEVTSKGVDLDVIWGPKDTGFTLQTGVTYADTKYGNFTPPFAALFRLPNAQMSFSPKWSASLAATYAHALGGNLEWRAHASAKHTSEYNTGSDLNPAKLQDSMTLVNARLGIGSQDKKWTVEAWAQNLTDKNYYQVVFDATLQPGTYDAFLGAPRTYGLTLRMQF